MSVRMSFVRLVILASFFSFTTASLPLDAACDAWSSSLFGGGIDALAIDPTNSSVLYAGTTGGVFKSTDGAATWTHRSVGMDSLTVNSIAIAASQPLTVFAAAGFGLFKSTDGAATWSPLTSLLAFPDAVAVDATDPLKVYVGTSSGMYRSLDGGQSWSSATTGPSSTVVRQILIDQDFGTLLFATTDAGLYRSADSGVNWSLITLTGASTALRVLVHPDSGNVFVTTDAGVFRSVDGGLTFIHSSSGITAGRVSGIAIDTTDPAVMYASGSDSFYESDTGGTTWEKVDTGGFARGTGLLGDPSSIFLYAFNGRGLARSTDSGATWTPMNSGLSAWLALGVAAHPLAPDRVYSWIFGQGLHQSTDSGATWDLSISNSAEALAFHPADPDTLMAAAGSGVEFSDDGGSNWESRSAGLTGFVADLVFAPSQPATAFAATDAGVFRTADSAMNWAPVNTGITTLDAASIAVHALNPDIAFVATRGGGLFKTTDGGSTWSAVAGGLDRDFVEDVVFHPQTPNRLFAVTDFALFESADTGNTWTLVTESTGETFVALTVAPSRPQTMYLATDRGVLRTVDGGSTWAPLDRGLGASFARSVAVDPLDPDLIHVAFFGNSVQSIALDDGFEILGIGGADTSDDTCVGAPQPLGLLTMRRHCDADWLTFDAVAGSSYEIETSALSDTSDTVLSVFSACDGSPIATNNDARGTMASKIFLEAPSTGPLHVLVEQHADSYEQTDTYGITISEQSLFQDGFESGDLSAWNP